MRKLILLLLATSSTCVLSAQNPKAVFKSLAQNDIVKSTERFEKIGDNTREKMPEMCYLAEAALLNMPQQLGVNKLQGYEILSQHIDAIRNSEDAEKIFHNLDITLEEVITNIESESFNYLMTLDTERNYVIYISWAKRGGHPRLTEIESRLEELRYTHTMATRSIEDCDFFLATYSESKYREAIAEHRTMLHYDEAMESNDEALLERFIVNYPTYKNRPTAERRLLKLRYDRIFKEGADNVEDMKWFLEQYPNHEEYASLKQRTADIEFARLPSTAENLAAFIAYYGDVSQRHEAQRRLHLARIAESGSVHDFVEYVNNYGYDTQYSVMLRNIYKHSKRFIITPEIGDVTLLRFAAEDGLVGYMDLYGNEVIEPIYDAKQVVFGTGHYNRAMLSEFTPHRNIVAISLNGSWGVINDKGEQIVEHKYQALTIFGGQIYAATEFKPEESIYCDRRTYVCDVYELDGKFVKSGETTEWDDIPDMRYFEGNDGIERGRYITPKYCVVKTKDNKSEVIDRRGNRYTIDWDIISGVTDNIAIVEAETKEYGKMRYYGNLETGELIKICPYFVVHPMSCGRAAVLDYGNTYAFIDENLELKIEEEFVLEHANKFNCGLMVVRSSEGVYGIINTDGEYLMTTTDTVADASTSTIVDVSTRFNDTFNQKGLFIISSGTQHTLIDSTGTILATIESPSTPEVCGIELIDSNGIKRVKFNIDPTADNQ